MTTAALPLAGLLVRRPVLFSTEPVDPATALGALFAAGDGPELAAALDRSAVQVLARFAGPLAPAFDLLPSRERERAAWLALWIEALVATADEGDRAERRLERLNRTAFTVARALAGERTMSPFAARFAAEARRRTFPRRSLDALLAQARLAVREPIDSTPEGWEIRARTLATAAAGALLGGEPTPATAEAAFGFLRLVRLMTLGRAAGRGFPLPIEAPPDASGAPPRAAMLAAIAAECEELHSILLRGARSLGEVPLTFRAALSGALALALRLLGKIEAHPELLLAGRIRVGRVERALALRRARRDSRA